MTTPTENKTHPAKFRADNRARIEDARDALAAAVAAARKLPMSPEEGTAAEAAVKAAQDVMAALDAEMHAAAADLPESVRMTTKDGATLPRTVAETQPGEMFDAGRTYATITLTDELRAAIYRNVQEALKSGANTTTGLVLRDIVAKHLGVTIDLTREASGTTDAADKIAMLKGQFAYEMAHPDWLKTPEGIAARTAAGVAAIEAAKVKAAKRAEAKAAKEAAPTA